MEVQRVMGGTNTLPPYAITAERLMAHAVPPNPDWVELDKFLAAFYPDVNERIYLQSFAPKSSERNERGTFMKLPESIAALRQFQPENFYYSRNEIINDEDVQHSLIEINQYCGLYFFVNAGGTRLEQITRINSLFCENDHLTIPEQHELLNGFSLAPSIRLETGKSVHAYWLLNPDNTCSSDEFRQGQKRLIEHFQSDGSLHNPNRIMRVPFFNHIVWNHIKERLDSKPVQLVEFEPIRRYSYDDLMAVLPELEVKRSSSKKTKNSRDRERTSESSANSTKAVGSNNSPSCSVEEPVYETGGIFNTQQELWEECKRRLLQHPTCKLINGYIHLRGLCHNGTGDKAIHINVATGQFSCNAGCDIKDIYRAVGLPTEPNGNTASEVINVHSNLEELLNASAPPVDEVFKYIERGTLSQFCAPTSAGKTTLLLNACIALAAGKQFLPLIPNDCAPRKVLYIDFETNTGKMQDSIRKMLSHVEKCWPDAKQRVLANMKLMVDLEIGGYPLDLSRTAHLDYVVADAQAFGAELIVVDNASAGFQLDNENDNSEVARKVMQPLKQLAKKTNAATILVHHTGKRGENVSQSIDALMGRGASNYGILSRTIYGLLPAANYGTGFVILHNTKNKGGPLLEPTTLRLDFDTLWFSAISDSHKVDVTAETVQQFVADSNGAYAKEIESHLMGLGLSQRTAQRRINEAADLKLISREGQRAKYFAPPKIREADEKQILVALQ